MANAFNILTFTRKADDQLIRLLENNTIGTPGLSMLYQHADVRKKVNNLIDPVFCNLTIRQKIYGTICFIPRRVFNSGNETQAYYLRYFTFQEFFRSGQKQKRKGSRSVIRKEVHNLMNGHGLNHTGPLLMYAYVDAENIRSKRLIVEFGFEKAGDFHTIPFSRLFPGISRNLQKIRQEDFGQIRALLQDFYKHHNLTCFEHLNREGNYYVIKENDAIVCGVQAIPDQWNIIELPGLTGRFMMNILPKIPWFRRLFQKDYKFIFLEAIYCKPGHEKQLEDLFASVLGIYKVHSGILCLDPHSSLYRQIKKLSLGITHMIMGEKPIEIFVKTPEKNHLTPGNPFFVSGYDVL